MGGGWFLFFLLLIVLYHNLDYSDFSSVVVCENSWARFCSKRIWWVALY